ncbi:short-chain fatty acyl-CoA regulator family protein [Sphingomonas naphthae]|uniref:Short-chain fatty acyl-CoA regulator family protein n=1 Tax=Sphingomonas naphthae TaxID=1813468 RepID=A0ABY7TNC3_9SPHN|nr:helix-turn-helix transcriptional regulator [Sphingomonas naphthae]WCT73900.1 short-chain fatty acyl-CoA regulator family protein [Sphingomonas naphthae]
MVTRRRLFMGGELRALRARAGLGQAAMAARLGLSVSYLSQLENDDRPVTAAVEASLAENFPLDWAPISSDDAGRRIAALREALADPLFAPLGSPEMVARAAEQQPALVDRFTALHAAYRRAEESRNIADEAIASDVPGADRQPWEEVRDWFHQAENYVGPLDEAAEKLADSLSDGALGEAVLESVLRDTHGIIVTPIPGEDARMPMRRFDPARGILFIDGSQPAATRRFILAHQLARTAFAAQIAAIADAAELRASEARRLLLVGLANYAAGALLMPYRRFRAAARDVRHDIDRLARRFGTSFEQTCHRLSTLQRPGARGIPFFFCRVDMAGNITKRHSATRLQFARFGGACPLWIVHEAVAIPDRVVVQLAETPDGVRYVSMAKGLVKPSGSYSRSPRRYAVALGCEASHAPDFIYADGLDVGGATTPIGISCRLCPRPDCDQRAFPPADRPIAIDPDVREVVPYRVL